MVGRLGSFYGQDWPQFYDLDSFTSAYSSCTAIKLLLEKLTLMEAWVLG